MSSYQTYWVEDCINPDIKEFDLSEEPTDEWNNHERQLWYFATKVKEGLPLCKFHRVGGRESSKLWVYHPNKTLCMGWITHGDYRTSSQNLEPKSSYVVYSRKITNNKYASYNHQCNMVMTGDIEKAVRNATRYLREYTIEEIAGIHHRDCRNSWGDTDNTVSKKIAETREHITDNRRSDPLHRELESLMQSGHKFIDPQFGERVSDFLGAHEEKKEALKDRVKSMVVVVVEQTLRGMNVYRIAKTPDISAWDGSWIATESVAEADLPDDIKGKISVLLMCTNDQYVDNVGYRVRGNLFYVVQ